MGSAAGEEPVPTPRSEILKSATARRRTGVFHDLEQSCMQCFHRGFYAYASPVSLV